LPGRDTTLRDDVELNGTIQKRVSWDEVSLKDGDVLEVVGFVEGKT
jgi:thiamine biosynthesis protein ThiS